MGKKLAKFFFWFFSLYFGCAFISIATADRSTAFDIPSGYVLLAPFIMVASSFEDAAIEKEVAAREQWQGELMRQAESEPGLLAENLRKIVAREVERDDCAENKAKLCEKLIATPPDFNIQKFMERFEKNGYYARRPHDDDDISYFLVGLTAINEDIDKPEAGRLGLLPVDTDISYPPFMRQLMIRAALLRNAVAEYSGPEPRLAAMADRLLVLDQSLEENYRRYYIQSQYYLHNSRLYELYLGMDYELRAYVGPESEFRAFADKAMAHYLKALQDGPVSSGYFMGGDWETAAAALLHYDRLAGNEAQRLAAVRLFIKNVPNEAIDESVPYKDSDGKKWPVWYIKPGARRDDGPWYYDNQQSLNAPYYRHLSRIWRHTIYWNWIPPYFPEAYIQPSIWDYMTIDWRADWGRQLDELLQQNKENKEISALLALAYPPRTQ